MPTKAKALAVIEYDVPDDYEPADYVSEEPRGLAYAFEELEGSDRPECRIMEIVDEAK